MQTLRQALKERVLLLDGAMGTEILHRNLSEQDFRGAEFAGNTQALKGNNDLLVLTRPDVIADIHDAYLAAGADLIETCTFNSNRYSQAEYGTEYLVRRLNIEGARLARAAADKYSTPDRPRFVLGSVGPTGKMLSMPAEGNPMFDELTAAFKEQISALIEGGVDAILLETIFDTLNAKAALKAAAEAIAECGRDVEIMLSATIADQGGHILSGQEIEAFVASMSNIPTLSIGLNCSAGASDMLPHLRRLRAVAPGYVSVHPNAGLPDRMGCYTHTPEIMVEEIKPFLAERLANIIGGCCGTTPAHIAAMRRMIDETRPEISQPHAIDDSALILSGLQRMVARREFVNVGERCNVAGSKKFLKLIGSGNYDEALTIARKQVEDGAMIIDINMDDAMLDARREMTHFLDLIGSDPDICRVPMMVDSSRFEVIEDALKHIQGKSVVNSLSLKEGEQVFLERAAKVKALGAAVIVMAFDERGQATSYERRIEICERAYRLLTEKVGFKPTDIIFDPNILTVATGMAEHADYALDFVRATRWIKEYLPGARVSGGLSNLSFAFRGNNFVREAMHAVFLYRAITAGMDMAIMNPATAVTYSDIPDELRIAIEDVLFDKRDAESTERLIAVAANYTKDALAACNENKVDEAPITAGDALVRDLLKGTTATLDEDLQRALAEYGSPMAIISGPLMQGMDQVGKLFGEGKMFLPQVVKTARTMKVAVDKLLSDIPDGTDTSTVKAGKILLATVKGDVHDIGKNIVGVILHCNNFEVIDLGVMVAPEVIVETAKRKNVDFVCLSGLITPSLEEMITVAAMMESAGLTIPIMIGGATTSPMHTALKIAPAYPSGLVVHVADASQNPILAARYINMETRANFIREVKEKQQQLTDRVEQRNDDNAGQALKCRPTVNFTHPAAPFRGARVLEPILIDRVKALIDWSYFYHAWKVDASNPEAQKLKADAFAIIEELATREDMAMRATVGFFEAKADAENIYVGDKVMIHTPRQKYRGEGQTCAALCDFVDPEGDVAGCFAVTVGKGFVDKVEEFKAAGDDYQAILWQTVGDRLAEAGSEYLQQTYSPTGIRPAIGYPSLPDQRQIFELAKLIDFSAIGIRLTENGAMYPQSSVSGLYILTPEAYYFSAK